jgi:hypothetical protein
VNVKWDVASAWSDSAISIHCVQRWVGVEALSAAARSKSNRALRQGSWGPTKRFCWERKRVRRSSTHQVPAVRQVAFPCAFRFGKLTFGAGPSGTYTSSQSTAHLPQSLDFVPLTPHMCLLHCVARGAHVDGGLRLRHFQVQHRWHLVLPPSLLHR